MKRDCNAEDKLEPLKLISKRGTRLDMYAICAECAKTRRPLWRYAESNKGVVAICNDCKAEAFDRSFGKKDALDLAKSGGAWEQDKRGH